MRDKRTPKDVCGEATYTSHLLFFVPHASRHPRLETELTRFPDRFIFFGIECQTTLKVQEELISRLPIKIYV